MSVDVWEVVVILIAWDVGKFIGGAIVQFLTAERRSRRYQ